MARRRRNSASHNRKRAVAATLPSCSSRWAVADEPCAMPGRRTLPCPARARSCLQAGRHAPDAMPDPRRAVAGSTSSSGGLFFTKHAALDLVFLDRFEQGLEIALAETFVALALDDLEKD